MPNLNGMDDLMAKIKEIKEGHKKHWPKLLNTLLLRLQTAKETRDKNPTKSNQDALQEAYDTLCEAVKTQGIMDSF